MMSQPIGKTAMSTMAWLRYPGQIERYFRYSHDQTAPQALDFFNGGEDVRVAGADDDNIMRIMGNGRGQSPLLQAKAGHQPQTDISRSPVPLHYRQLQDVPAGVRHNKSIFNTDLLQSLAGDYLSGDSLNYEMVFPGSLKAQRFHTERLNVNRAAESPGARLI